MKRLAAMLVSVILILSLYASSRVVPQTRERTVTQSKTDKVDTVKVDVDLVVLDALVLQKKTARVVGNLKQGDFVVMEDGVRQQITHFGQDTQPLSVLLLVDRGGCLDPFGEQVRAATLAALARLKPQDEVALMAYSDRVELVQGFVRDRKQIEDALGRVPRADEEADHCLNRAFYDAARYMVEAGNPVGRRVIIVITGVTSNFDCEGPSSKEAAHAIYESGSVVCGLIPSSAGQRMENGIVGMGTRIGRIFKVPTISINQLAEETGGEVLDDKPETLDRAFNTLIDHLRTRYQLGFVSSNKKRDGTTRKLKVEITPTTKKSQGELVVKTRRTYIAPKS
ncbi:MAG: VWA domain-containing protein [Pyrinomonadaceae bacterium]|nr:VWA domain-containing protein [Pyrinomonadaceae bacterium]